MSSGINKYAVLREFPFLSGFCHPTELINACVKRFDKEVLSIKLSDCNKLQYDGIYLLDARGNILVQLISDGGVIRNSVSKEIGFSHYISKVPVKIFKPWTWFYIFSIGEYDSENHWASSTISDLFAYLGSSARHVKYVVDIRKRVLTLHKPPKNQSTIGEWLISNLEESDEK